MKTALALALVSFAAAHVAQARESSFDEVRARVYGNPSKELPHYPGLSASTLAKAFFLRRGEFVDRVRGTVREPVDFKEPVPKLLHPMGVCADAVWRIDAPSPATGLLRTGTEVNAIVRFSTGNSETEYKKGKKRVFGLAVKLFPTQSKRQPIETSNVFLLDQFSVDGNERPYFLKPGKDGAPLRFTNEARGSGVVNGMVRRIFGWFDSDPTLRPLYPLTEIDATSQTVTAARTPGWIELTPRTVAYDRSFADFRSELLQYQAGELVFDIALPAQAFTEGHRIPLGTLTIGEPVVSETCDRELHFHHHPNRVKHRP